MRKLIALGLVLVVAGPGGLRAQDAEVIEVPLSVHGGRLIVPVTAADGSTLEFALSTGNGNTVLSESTAERLGQLGGLDLGGVAVPTDGHAAIPDARLETGGKMLAGMIGANLLNQFDVLVDAPAGRLVLKPFARSVAWEGMELSEPVRLRVYHGVVLSVDVQLDGQPYGAMLDIGTQTTVVNEGVARALTLDAEDTATLRIGDTDFPGVPVQVEDLEVLRRFDPDGKGFMIVGAAIARDCAISISWIHRELRTCVR